MMTIWKYLDRILLEKSTHQRVNKEKIVLAIKTRHLLNILG